MTLFLRIDTEIALGRINGTKQLIFLQRTIFSRVKEFFIFAGQILEYERKI